MKTQPGASLHTKWTYIFDTITILQTATPKKRQKKTQQNIKKNKQIHKSPINVQSTLLLITKDNWQYFNITSH